MTSDTPTTRLYLHLSPEMQQALPEGIEALIEREGIDLPPQLSLSSTSMPVAPGAPVAKDAATAINISIDLTLNAEALALLIGTVSASLSALILAVNQALKDRGHSPRVVKVDEVVPITRADGSTAWELREVRQFVEPGPQLKAALKARLGAGKGVAVDFDVET
jgi:hypothetical protein